MVELDDVNTEQPSSSMWSSSGRGVQGGLVQMEGTRVFSKPVLDSIDGTVAA